MIIEICPNCSSPGLDVEKVTVDFFTGKSNSLKANYYACCNRDCKIAYFSRGNIILCDQLISPLWYKDSSINVPVCYCSDISRLEIYESVYSYSAETIDDVQKILNKNRTGYCKEENPVGGCCRNLFLFTIAQGKKIKRKSIVKCPNCRAEEVVNMPFNSSVTSYKCNSCGESITPLEGDCCIFCSYGSEKCPTIQLKIDRNR